MTAPIEKESLRAALLNNLERWGMKDAQVLIGAVGQGLPRVRIVHANLATWSPRERGDRLLAGISIDRDLCELITPEEEEWYGVAFPENLTSLPIWTDVLSDEEPRGGHLLFASDLDSDIDRPAVVTFYSLRGGVGRTTALGSAAKVLASRGRRVLCIDMDFEAPGLAYFFGLDEPEEDIGSLSLLVDLEEGGQEPDIRDHVQRVSDEDELYCLPAGRLGVEYAKRLEFLDPTIWYREQGNPLHRLLDLISESTISPDIVLVDSRTGIAPISAPLLFDVSDLAVVCFFPHPQAKRGTELLVRSLFGAKSRRSAPGREISPEPRFLVSPVPPGPSATRVRERASDWISSWLEPAQTRREADVGPLRVDELTHFISYSADVAFRDQLVEAEGLREVYGPVADWLEQLFPVGRGGPGTALQPASKPGPRRCSGLG